MRGEGGGMRKEGERKARLTTFIAVGTILTRPELWSALREERARAREREGQSERGTDREIAKERKTETETETERERE